MEKNNICPDCGAELRIDRCGCAVTYTCPKCGWSVATTEWEPIDLDETEYAISIADGTVPDKKTLSLVSRMTGLNFIASKKLIESRGILWSGRARDAQEKIAFLKSEGLPFQITPTFPY